MLYIYIYIYIYNMFKGTAKMTGSCFQKTCCSCPSVFFCCPAFNCYLMSDLLILCICIFIYLFFSIFFFFFFLYLFFLFYFTFFYFSIYIFIYLFYFIYLIFEVIICYLDLSWNFYCHEVSVYNLDLSSWICLLGLVLDLSQHYVSVA